MTRAFRLLWAFCTLPAHMVEFSDVEPGGAPDGWTRSRIVFLGISGSLLVLLLFAVREVLLPFILALIIAYVLTPLVAWGEMRLKLPRSVSIILVYLVVIGTLVISIMAMAPRIYDESVHFAREVPRVFREGASRHGRELEKWVNAYQAGGEAPADQPTHKAPALIVKKQEDGYLVELGSGIDIIKESDGHYRVQPRREIHRGGFQISTLVREGVDRFLAYVELNALEFIKLGQAIFAGFSRAILLVFMTLMVAGYLMHTRENVLGFFRSLPPRMHQPGFDFLLRRIDRGLSGVVRGQLLICLVNGLLSALGFYIFGLKYWPVLALVAGVMSIVPIFGSILSTVPAVLVGLTQDIWTAFWVLIWIVGIHQVEANVLNPKIIGVAAKLHPVLVVFSLLVGEHFYGIWGALLAVPILSVSQSVFNHFRFGLPDSGPDSMLPPAPRRIRLRL